MTELWLCVACTLAVPFLAPFTIRWHSMREVFRGFTFFALLCLLFGELLPDAVRHGGPWVLSSALIGVLLPRFLEESRRWNHRSLHQVMIWLGVTVFIGHAALDGFVLGFADQEHHGHTHHGFAFGVIFHRFPVAFSIWWLLRERLGMRSAYLGLVALALATIGGALSDERWLDELSALNFGLIQGLISGLLVHVLFHQPHEHHGSHSLQDGAGEQKLLDDPLSGEWKEDAQAISQVNPHKWWQRSPPELLGALIASSAFFFYHESGHGGVQGEGSAVMHFLTLSLMCIPAVWIGLVTVHSLFSNRSST